MCWQGPFVGLPRMTSRLVVVGLGVKGERSESHRDRSAAQALDARTGDHPTQISRGRPKPHVAGKKLIMLDVEVVVPLLRAKEVAALLAVSVWHLDQLRRDGLIKSVHVGSRTHRYHPDDVAEFVRRRRG